MRRINYSMKNQQPEKKDQYRTTTTYDDDFYVKKIELPEFGIKVTIERCDEGYCDMLVN